MSVDEILTAHKGKKEELIAALQGVQDKEGYISKTNIANIAKALGVPTSKVYGVVTFYSLFKLKEAATYTVFVCEGTACHVRGAPKVIEALEKNLGVKTGEMTSDRLFSIEIVRCLGLCASAPLIKINDEVYPKISIDDIPKILDSYRNKK